MSSRGATPGIPDSLVIVFARAPQPGRVKTRLAPLLGPAGAARLQARLVTHALATALRSGAGAVELCGTPRMRHPFFLRCRREYGVRLQAQGAGDLGARMLRAFRRALRGVRHVVLVGSDCPELSPADLRAALRALCGGADAVLAPAEDGGYALIGLRRPSPALFEGIEWGGSEVLAQTRGRLARLRWRTKELRTVWDVDRPEDARRLGAVRLLRLRPRPPS